MRSKSNDDEKAVIRKMFSTICWLNVDQNFGKKLDEMFIYIENIGNILRPVAFSSKRKGTQGFSRGGGRRKGSA